MKAVDATSSVSPQAHRATSVSLRNSNPSNACPRWMWNDPIPASFPENSTTMRRPIICIFAVSERVLTAGSSRTRETLAELYVVDADVHVHEDVAELAEHAEPPWDVALREIAKVEERYLDDLAATVRSLRNQGRGSMGTWLEHERLGFNYRMDEMSAALGLSQLERLDTFLAKRGHVAQMYTEHLAGFDWIRTPKVKPGVKMSWFVYVVTLAAGEYFATP